VIEPEFLLEDVEFFAGLEADGFTRGDGDFGTGPRIAAYAGFARLDGEYAKAAEFDAVTLDQALLHGLEDGIDCRFGLGPDQPGTLYDTLNQILLDHLALACFRALLALSDAASFVGRLCRKTDISA
jgi:hypothetical protein